MAKGKTRGASSLGNPQPKGKAKSASSSEVNGQQLSVEIKDSSEVAFIIAFCEKFKSVLRSLSFWTEDFEEALQTHEESELLERMICVFLTNFLNRKKLIETNNYQALLSTAIDQHIEQDNQSFYLDHNPLKDHDGKINFFALDTKDKISILHCLVHWQLQESEVIRKLIGDSYKRYKKTHENLLEYEIIGEDSKNAKYYHINTRIYREKLPRTGTNFTSKNVKWEAVTTNLEEVQALVNSLNPKRAKEKGLHVAILEKVMPEVENRYKVKEKQENLQKRKAAKAEWIEVMRTDAISTRTRAASRKAEGIDTPVISYREDDYDYGRYEGFAPYPNAGRKKTSRSLRQAGDSRSSSDIGTPNNTSTQTSLPTNGRMTRSRFRLLSTNNLESSNISLTDSNTSFTTIDHIINNGNGEVMIASGSTTPIINYHGAETGDIDISDIEMTEKTEYTFANSGELLELTTGTSSDSNTEAITNTPQDYEMALNEEEQSIDTLEKETSFASTCGGSVMSISSITTPTNVFRPDVQEMSVDI
ncbi:4835_t:CDS:2 [Ambispora gerdemannii]|uniref:4835_t:CDS:1 n=1 Tax=Ambispora gerdemannii TaxID=144530 RepID=A0A9N8ZY38_9GLOM|nr:4835_t:CDS:2 [Ambispora gerdemannii]